MPALRQRSASRRCWLDDGRIVISDTSPIDALRHRPLAIINVGEDWRLEVTDETGLILFLMTFSIMQSPAVPLPRTKGTARLT